MLFFFDSLLWIGTVTYKFQNGHKTHKSTMKVVHATHVPFSKSFETINPWHINRWNSIVFSRPIFSMSWFIKPNLNQTDLFWFSDSFTAFTSSLKEKINSKYIKMSVCFSHKLLCNVIFLVFWSLKASLQPKNDSEEIIDKNVFNLLTHHCTTLNN